ARIAYRLRHIVCWWKDMCLNCLLLRIRFSMLALLCRGCLSVSRARPEELGDNNINYRSGYCIAFIHQLHQDVGHEVFNVLCSIRLRHVEEYRKQLGYESFGIRNVRNENDGFD